MTAKKKTVKISTGKGSPAIKFKKGGLHESTHTPKGEKIPASKLKAAAAGKYGPKARKQAALAKGLKKMRGGK